MNTNHDALREAFEAAVKRRFPNHLPDLFHTRKEDGQYSSNSMREWWMFWQDCAALAQPQAHGEPGNNEGESDGRNDKQRPALGTNLPLGVSADISVACSSYSSLPSLTDLLWGSDDVMALNAELGLTMDQLSRIANVVLQSHREALAQHRAALEECVKSLAKCSAVIRTRQQKNDGELTSGDVTDAVYSLDAAGFAITHANQVLEGGGK
jgi:hypothetical protein